MANDKDTPTIYERKPWKTAAIWAIPGTAILSYDIWRFILPGLPGIPDKDMHLYEIYVSDVFIGAPIQFVACLLVNRVCVAIYRKFSLPPDGEWRAMVPFFLFLVVRMLWSIVDVRIL